MCIRDIYYEEAEKQNKEVQKLKHDMKHKLHELYHLVENSDGHEPVSYTHLIRPAIKMLFH